MMSLLLIIVSTLYCFSDLELNLFVFD